MAEPSPPTSTAKTGVLEAGSLIAGRYKVEALLGSGGMGSVYRVQHTHMRKRFALKILNADAAQRSEMVARFEREAMATAHIEHPNITASVDFGRAEDGSFFLVLEYLEGERLRDTLAKGPLPVHRAVHIARQVASALSKSHEHGVIHRDLKPENIMLVTRQDDNDFVKVLDFGFAKVMGGMPEPGRGGPADALSRKGTLYGTPGYMSPEHCVGSAVDARTDLYTLGLILYEMLAGVGPFGTGNALKIIRHQISTKTPPIATIVPGITVPASLEAVVMRLTEKEPEKRYASATEVIAALFAVAKQEGIPLSEPSSSFLAPQSQPDQSDQSEKPVLGIKDSAGEVQTLASVDLIAAQEPPAASIRLAVNESQILSEKIARKPPAEEVTRPAMASPTIGAFKPAVSLEQKTAVLPMTVPAARESSFSRRIRERLPASLQNVPLPLILLAPASLFVLLLLLLGR